MKRSVIVSAVIALGIVGAFVGVAQAQKEKQVLYVSSAKDQVAIPAVITSHNVIPA